PWVMTRTTSNAWKLRMRLVVATNATLGRRSGHVTNAKRRMGPAPSRAAAPWSAGGGAPGPAREGTNAEPPILHTLTRAHRASARLGSPSQLTGRSESARRSALTTPPSASRIHIQSSATATHETTYALKTAPRKKPKSGPGRSRATARARPTVVESVTTTAL